MRFEFKKDELLQVIKNCALIVPTKSTMPIIRNLKLELKGDYLHINSTDSDIKFFQSYKPLQIREYGKCLIDASTFKKLLEKIDNEIYSFELQETSNSVNITNENAEFNMPISRDPGNEFPEADMTIEYDSEFQIPSNKLLDSLEKTVFATRDEPSRYQMNGVLLKCEDENENILAMCATDTKRLALQHIALSADPSLHKNLNDINWILSTKLCELMIKIISTNFKKQIVNIEIAFKNQKVYIDLCNIQIVSKLVAGIFPDYKRAIPSEPEKLPNFDRKALIKTLEKSMLFTNEITKSINFHFNHEKVLISSSMPELGESHFKVPYTEKLSTYEGDTKMAFNPSFLMAGLKAIDADIVQIALKDPKSPMIISGDPGYIYLLMPV